MNDNISSMGWRGEKVRLVPLEKDRHFDNCLRWLNDPVVTQWLLTGDFPLTRLAEQEFFDRVSRTNDKDIAFAIETLGEDEEHIGVCGLHQISFRDGTGVLGLAIGRPKLWGKGYGSDTIAVMTRYAFQVVGLRLILAEIFAENAASMRIFAKHGYTEVARVPQRRWKRGAHRDEVTVALLRDTWLSHHNPHPPGPKP